MKHIFSRWALAGLTLLGGAGSALAAPFTPGNLVVARVGDGSASLTAAAAAVFLLEYKPDGTLVQTIAVPTTVSGPNRALTASGTATSELNVTRSADGRYLVITGYDAAVGTATVASGTTAVVSNRVIGRVAADGTVDTSTRLKDAFDSNNIRGAFTTDGANFYAVGANSGVRYVPFGNTDVSTALNTAPTNIRYVNGFGGNLYVSSGSSAALGVSQVGTGLPTTSGQTATLLPGLETATGSSPYAFFLADLSATVAGVDVAYVADDRAAGGGIRKYSLVGGTWVLNGTIAIAGATPPALRGLAGRVSTTGAAPIVSLAATAISGLYLVSDAAGYNVAPTTTSLSATPAVAATTDTVLRGVAFAPEAAVTTTPTLTATPVGPLTFSTAVNTASAAQTISVSGSSLTGSLTVTASAGYEVATSASGTYGGSLTLPATGGSQAATPVFVRLAPAATAGPVAGTLTVTSTGAETKSITLNGTVTAAPVVVPAITSFAPAAGPVGTVVTVTGTSLEGATAAAVNGTPGTNFMAMSATEVMFTVAPGSTTGPITVTTPTGTATSATSFTVSPRLSTLLPTRAVAGGPAFGLTINGTNFTAGTQITFGNATYPAASVAADGRSLTVSIPASAIAAVATVKVSVTSGGLTSNVFDFFVVPAAPIQAFEDFESASRTDYTDATPVALRSGAWTFSNAVIGEAFSDKVNQIRSARLRGNGFITMNFDKPNGAGTVTVSAALFGTNTGASFTAEISTDGGTAYTPIAGTPATLTATLTPYALTVNQPGNVRLRFRTTNLATTGGLINLDDLFITSFVGTATRAGSALPGLTLYPNPTRDLLTVVLPRAGAARVTLRDLTGRLVLAPAALPASGQLRWPASLAAGTYLLEVQQGPETAVRRVVKE